MWSFTGKFRLHFNRPNEAPRFVSVTAPDHSWEMICKTVEIEGLWLEANADMTAPEMSPKWWLEGTGTIIVSSTGHMRVYKTPTSSTKQQRDAVIDAVLLKANESLGL